MSRWALLKVRRKVSRVLLRFRPLIVEAALQGTPAAAQAVAEKLRAEFAVEGIPWPEAQRGARLLLEQLFRSPDVPNEVAFPIFHAIAVAFNIEQLEIRVNQSEAAGGESKSEG